METGFDGVDSSLLALDIAATSASTASGTVEDHYSTPGKESNVNVQDAMRAFDAMDKSMELDLRSEPPFDAACSTSLPLQASTAALSTVPSSQPLTASSSGPYAPSLQPQHTLASPHIDIPPYQDSDTRHAGRDLQEVYTIVVFTGTANQQQSQPVPRELTNAGFDAILVESQKEKGLELDALQAGELFMENLDGILVGFCCCFVIHERN